jgi:LmbE family N-acetylglucosaminyl deacetylase
MSGWMEHPRSRIAAMKVHCIKGQPSVIEIEILTELSVEADVAAVTLGELGTVDGDHAWLQIDELRRAAHRAGAPEGWDTEFERMIAYAKTKGWISDDGCAVRAHIDRTADVRAPSDR